MRWYFVIDEKGLWHWEREQHGVTTEQACKAFPDKALCIADARLHGFGAGAGADPEGAARESRGQLAETEDS